MKKSLMFLLLVFVSFNTFSKGVKIKSTIEEDPKVLFIKIEVLREGKFSHFKKSYDVSGKNFLQRDLILTNAFESLGESVPLHELDGSVFSWVLIKIYQLVLKY